MSAETIIEMAREVALRKRERALTAALLETATALNSARMIMSDKDLRDMAKDIVDNARAALALPGAPE